MPTDTLQQRDYVEIAKRLSEGTIVPFFGAGASVGCGFPSGAMLAERLARKASFPDDKGREDLALVASYLVVSPGLDSVTLRTELRQAMAVSASPGLIHRCLANPKLHALRLFVTTNYDDLLEKALEPRSPYVVVDRGEPGKVWVRQPGQAWKEVASKNLRSRLTDEKRPIVLKLHGSLDQEDRRNDSFLITEEHYVDFLGRSVGGLIPSMLATAMKEQSFLFLGYGLRDWNVRVLLRKLGQSRGRPGRIRSWAIVRKPGLAERELWRAQEVEMHDIALDDFAKGLERHL